MDLIAVNKELKDKSPAEIVRWALEQGSKPVVTTNFRPYEAAILYATTSEKKDMPVIWCDTGYNTNKTYQHAQRVIEDLQLRIKLYVPRQTAAYRDTVMGGIPGIDDPLHKEFTEQVKLEPFRRAMQENQPDVWFTNLRKGQTAFRDTLDIVTQGEDDVLKVSPFFYWTDQELDVYLEEHKLENEFKYFDPTKVLENRECGLHVN